MKCVKNPLGKMILRSKIGRGNNADVWKAYFPRKYREFIVKRINLGVSSMYCRFAWKDAGFKAPKSFVKIAKSINVKGLAQFPEQLSPDSVHCVSNIQAFSNSCETDDARVLRQGNEFYTEVAVGACLNVFVNPRLPISTFCRNIASWKSRNYGNIAMDYAGKSLEASIDTLNLRELQSVVLQVLVALQWSQSIIKFKHHDLHSGNVFIRRKKNIPLKWSTPCGRIITLPATNVQAVIADFGLSAATHPLTMTRYCRMDYDFLDCSDAKIWGKWNHELSGNEGYDSIVFLESLRDDSHILEHVKWLSKLLRSCKKQCQNYSMSKSTGRPLNDVSLTPAEILSFCIKSMQEA